MAKAVASAVVLRIELLDVQPMVWRRVRVPAATSLHVLHGVLQLVMGWQDSHVHEFRVDEEVIGVADQPELQMPEGIHSETEWTVAQVVEAGYSEFEYVYDFGDDWRHRLVIEPASRSRVPGDSLLCLAGENACPPEDVGGHKGYAAFLEALADTAHPEHDAYANWVGGVWDDAGFDLNRVNRELRKLVGRG